MAKNISSMIVIETRRINTNTATQAQTLYSIICPKILFLLIVKQTNKRS